MNANTLVSFVNGTNRNQIPALTLASTTATAFSVNTDTGTTVAALAVPTGSSPVGSRNPQDSNANASIISQSGREYGNPLGTNRPFYTTASFDGKPFKVRLVGTGTAAANAGNTLTLSLYQGTSATLASDHVVAATAAVATASAASLNFVVEATLLWDSTLQSLAGSYNYVVNFNGTLATGALPVATTAQASLLTTPVAVTTAAGLSFLPAVTWGNAVGGTIQITEFSIEQV